MLKSKKRRPIQIDQFDFLSPNELPCIVLGIHLTGNDFGCNSITPYDFTFKRGRKWSKIAHHTGGSACHLHFWIGTVLEIKESVRSKLESIDHQYRGTNTGMIKPSLNEIAFYRSCLKNFGADCNNSFRLFEEAQYPVDVDVLGQLSDENLPKDLDELIEWDCGMERAIGSIYRWNAAILTKNTQ